MGTNHLSVQVFQSPAEAPNYRKSPTEFRHAELDGATIVHKGMINGNSTVDLLFHDNKGNKYIAMITGKLLKSVAQLCLTDNDD